MVFEVRDWIGYWIGYWWEVIGNVIWMRDVLKFMRI